MAATPSQGPYGHVDLVKGLRIAGWAADFSDPSHDALVTLLHDGREIAAIAANSFRPDLLEAGIGTGRHGWEMMLAAPPVRSGVVEITAVVSGPGSVKPVPMVGSPVTIDLDAVTDPVAMVAGSALFDKDAYAAAVPECAALPGGAAEHYVAAGWRSGIRPGPLFDTDYYLEQNPGVAAEGNPLLHYLRRGALEGLTPHPLFDPAWYAQRNNLLTFGIDLLDHYLRTGWRNDLMPHPLFDGAWYLRQNPDVAAAKMNPLIHYLRWGSSQNRDPSPLFELAWYRERYPDVEAHGLEPLTHYVRHGAREKRRPNPYFDAILYATLNPGAEVAGLDPVQHLLRVKPAERYSWARPGAFTRAASTQLGAPRGAWGGEPLAPADLFGANQPARVSGHDLEAFAKGTAAITAAYLTTVQPEPPPPPSETLAAWAPIDEMRDRIAGAPPCAEPPPARFAVSIVTPYFRHMAFFRACARAVAAVMVHERERGAAAVEWVVVNDDPDASAEELRLQIPLSVAHGVTILSDGQNRGIATRLNEAWRAARNPWIVFLDCDDRLRPDALQALAHYAERFPAARYISSAMTDIDEHGRMLRQRIRGGTAADLVDRGMVAGHLMAVRQDLLVQRGGLRSEYSGCQDFDLALRAALNERILLVPDLLYEYRWHKASQSVSAQHRQARIAARVLRRACSDAIEHSAAPAHLLSELPRRSQRGLVAIRTTGRRLALLAETVDSVLAQRQTLEPCVVVHADAATFAAVRAFLTAREPSTLVLHAERPWRSRGYPINVAMDHLLENQDKYGFFCILDDDDIYYPGFGAAMSAAMTAGRADVVYCLTHEREGNEVRPSRHLPLPSVCLAIVNFIPTNAIAVATDFLATRAVRVREDMHYLEDWDFLLTLLEQGARFSPLREVLSEYRILGDGNRESKLDPERFAVCQRRVLERGRSLPARLAPGAYVESILDFDFARAAPFGVPQRETMASARNLFAASTARRFARAERIAVPRGVDAPAAAGHPPAVVNAPEAQVGAAGAGRAAEPSAPEAVG